LRKESLFVLADELSLSLGATIFPETQKRRRLLALTGGVIVQGGKPLY
jgi:hypothetical protein